MTVRSFSSFDALREEMAPSATSGPEASEVLRVAADVHGDDSAADACREVALDWLGSRFGASLPEEASRFETFALHPGGHAVEGARVRSDGDDVWAARLVHAAGPEGGWVTEVGVREQRGHSPEFRLRLLRQARTSADDDGPRVPDLLTRLASAVELRRDGRRITSDPWVVGSASAAHELCGELASPKRRLPWLVLSMPEAAPGAEPPLLDPVGMARATAGLAVVVVLPAEFTWTLTRAFDRQRSVYLGAVRLYFPGFGESDDPWRHPLVVADKMREPEDLASQRDGLLRRIAEHSLTLPGAWSFAQVRELALESGASPAPTPLEPEQSAPAPPAPHAAPIAPPDPVPRAEQPSPATEDHASEAASGPLGVLIARGAAAWRALRGAPDPEVERRVASLRRERDRLERRLKASEERRRDQRAKATKRLANARNDRRETEREWEEAEQRADDAVRDRDLAVAEVTRLRDLVVALGGTPSVPRRLPTRWSDFAPWCEAGLTSRVRLLPKARRELKRARFADVELAARCLLWLGGPYRRLRLEASGQGLKATVENGVHNQPCGGDAYTIKWRGRSRRVDWHIKSGGSTHDPRRCLRIYYFWDSSSSEVVVASMPGHLRTDAT